MRNKLKLFYDIPLVTITSLDFHKKTKDACATNRNDSQIINKYSY